MYKKYILISGTGQNTGKTLLVCSIVKKFQYLKPIYLKISTHFHTKTSGLTTIFETENFKIFEETDAIGIKDTQRTLNAGAYKSFYIQTYENYALDAFHLFIENLNSQNPVLIESNVLASKIASIMKIIMTGGTKKIEDSNSIFLHQTKIDEFTEKLEFKKDTFFIKNKS